MIIGYTNGYYDILHIGHLSLLRNASALCDRLIVGVIADDECRKRKKKTPVIPLNQRLEIIRSVKYVDAAVPVYRDDKLEQYNKYHYNILFVGSDHFEEPLWIMQESGLETSGVRVIYIENVKGISTTVIKERIVEQANKNTQEIP